MTAPRKPPGVDDIETFWTEPPPERSLRLVWWLGEIERGWRPNRRIRLMGYHCSAEYFGVYIWEYLHVLSPLLDRHMKPPD